MLKRCTRGPIKNADAILSSLVEVMVDNEGALSGSCKGSRHVLYSDGHMHTIRLFPVAATKRYTNVLQEAGPKSCESWFLDGDRENATTVSVKSLATDGAHPSLYMMRCSRTCAYMQSGYLTARVDSSREFCLRRPLFQYVFSTYTVQVKMRPNCNIYYCSFSLNRL